ncbi:thioredoxin-disulfide reductase [Entomobacter blattae]|uniref:Thioredoxin reductase n=1 Tax=Entomobacter blattae TaxID=2762277 RepID=A0A7H1NNL7_9PROT|nr:thioredoxin-disulfide reductase [Entomobacter blattae]QNT77377.1 Thioredoxin reductase [Entomobacter blattae]
MSENTIFTDVLIIGAGPAGYTAAIYAARANLKPVLVAGLQPGGQLMITTEIENFPGFANPIQGPWLMQQMQEQAENVGAKIEYDIITQCHLKQNILEGRPFQLVGDSGTHYQAKSVIIATGAQARWLGLKSETRLQGAGVSACATCDGFFFKGKEVAVVGGGNTAVEEALYLTHHADKVTLIHRRDSLRAEKILQDRLFANSKISVLWNSTVEEVLEDTNSRVVSGVRVHNSQTNTTTTLPLDGVFIAIGHTPNTQLFQKQVELDSEGYIITTPGTTQTSLPGVFAAGDVQDKTYRQAITAAGTGCMAALEAERFLATIHHVFA